MRQTRPREKSKYPNKRATQKGQRKETKETERGDDLFLTNPKKSRLSREESRVILVAFSPTHSQTMKKKGTSVT